MPKKKIVVLTGAGISAESGLKTFRDADGLWEGHRVQDVATPEAYHRNPSLVNEFYNQRRNQLLEAKPNSAHQELAKLEKKYHVVIITQNVDNLHERGGSQTVLHLHGELFKVRSTGDSKLVYDWQKDIRETDRCEKGYPLRPHIVWFGEEVPMLEKAIQEMLDADICLIIGTSMQVYPAAGLVSYLKRGAELYYIDPNPHINQELKNNPRLRIIAQKATEGVKRMVEILMEND